MSVNTPDLHHLALTFNRGETCGADVSAYAELCHIQWTEALDRIAERALELSLPHHAHVIEYHNQMPW